MKYSVLIILTIFLLFSPPSSALNNGYARIVYNVNGLQDYDLHWNDKFPQGSTVIIYVEAFGINHKRQIGVDYVFIIKDSNNNVIDTKSFSNKNDDYTENDFITYSMKVPQSWEDGVYTADIHIFDLLNDTIMDDYQDNVTVSLLNSSGKPDIPYMERGEILNLPQAEKSQQYINIEKIFFIDRYADKYPADRFRVENIELDKIDVAPLEPVLVKVNISNNFNERGSTSIDLLLDNEVIDNTTIEIDGKSTGVAIFRIFNEHIGNHTLEIVPTGNNTIAVDAFTFYEVNALKKFDIPAEFQYLDLQIDKLNVEQDKIVNITLTLENKGNKGTQPVSLYINDELLEEEQVHLDYLEIKNITFKISRPDIGAYRVSFGESNLTRVFFVGSPTPAPVLETDETETEKSPQLRIVLVLSILVVFIYILRIYLKRKLK